MEKKATERRAPGPTDAPLPAERAFVVQLRAQADPNEDLFVGRAEHIASGATARFDSAEALIAFVTRVLEAPTSFSGEISPPTEKGQKTE